MTLTEHETTDMTEAYKHMSGLSEATLIHLERGPRPGDTECAICRCPFSEVEHGPWLIGFHGMDAMRCGVIYGMAKAIRQERWKAGVERMRREHPEQYR